MCIESCILLLIISQHAQLSADITTLPILWKGQRLGLYIQRFNLHAVACDGFDYFGDISKAIVGRSSDCAR